MRRTLFLLAVVCSVVLSCAGPGTNPNRGEDSLAVRPWWDFVVEVGPRARLLEVSGQFETGTDGLFEIDAVSAAAIQEVRLESGEALVRVEGGWRVPNGFGFSSDVLRLRWEVDLDRISRSRNYSRVTEGERAAYLTQAGMFLLRPVDGWRGVRARIQFTLADGVQLASGMMRGRDANSFVVPASRIDHLPATVLGEFSYSQLAVGDSTIDLAVLPGRRHVSDEEVQSFVQAHTGAVADFYGKFPVAHALVVLLPNRRGGYGRANGSGGASVLYLLNRRDDYESVMGDWVLVHELLHFACPLLAREHHWFEEGLSTYFEPIVRQGEGWQTGEEVWAELHGKMFNGLPQAGDLGLDRTRTWGRTYWGGALFCMLADIEIRKQTNNAKSLRDAMRAVVESGGSILRPATMRETLQTGDDAIGVAVLVPLWEAMRNDPYPVDLDQLWTELGIERVDGGLRFDDSAQFAWIREAIARTVSEAPTSSN